MSEHKPQEPEAIDRALERINAVFGGHYNGEGSDPTDLLTDLLHWCESSDNPTGQPFKDHLRIARTHHKAER